MGDGDVAANGGQRAHGDGSRVGPRVRVEREVEQVGAWVERDEVGLLRLELGGWEDVSGSSEDWLECFDPSISDVVVHHFFVVLRALEGVVSVAVMGVSTPAMRAIGKVVDGEAELAEGAEEE